MKTYEYRGFGSDGRSCRGLVEALSAKQAREKLVAAGVLAERVRITGRRSRFPAVLRALVYRDISVLLGAGLPLVRAFDILIDSPELNVCRGILAGVRDRVREGVSLADAVAQASPSVSGFEQAVIEAAERSATVEKTLAQLAGFLEEEAGLREKVCSSLIYPGIVFTAGVCMAVVTMSLLLPRTRELLVGMRVPMPPLTEFMIGLGGFLAKAGPVTAVVLAGAVVFARVRIRNDASLRRRLSRLGFRVPVAGKFRTLLANLRFARTLSILLSGGVPMIDAFRLAGRATGSSWVENMTETEAGKVRHGDRLSDAVRRVPPLADSMPGWIEIGEAGGGMADLLATAADRYQQQWTRYTDRMLSLLEPLLILLIGAFVLLVALSVLLPVFSFSRVVAGG